VKSEVIDLIIKQFSSNIVSFAINYANHAKSSNVAAAQYMKSALKMLRKMEFYGAQIATPLKNQS